jgi:hypothetical protein
LRVRAGSGIAWGGQQQQEQGAKDR